MDPDVAADVLVLAGGQAGARTGLWRRPTRNQARLFLLRPRPQRHSDARPGRGPLGTPQPPLPRSGGRRTGRSTAPPRNVPRADPAAHQTPPRSRAGGRQAARQDQAPACDFHHKTARALITDYDVIAHERLNTAGMTKSPAPKADPGQPGSFLPNGAAATAGLNRSILDAGWAHFLGILANKAESAGRLVVPVDARDTSCTCPSCGHVAKKNRVTQGRFQCTACGFAANADHVGATNVLDRAGPALCAAAQPPTQEAHAFARGWSHPPCRGSDSGEGWREILRPGRRHQQGESTPWRRTGHSAGCSTT
jgi:predicted RNA-binding Zn-ribbon protein involved in translation (DUF1610 family)